ncbi:kelch-like protein 10 [Zootermopsis nevadensis]|uniref:kelch-like protein 10 n=1 Tax=Zootermopsis nevadensis TaxID=136037 RepID=UPI000B8EE1A4|nr:kelch-like protein 10 [Zootermopsis nevadensis]
MAELLKNVRLGLIEKEFLQEIRSHPYVKENETWRPVIHETLDFLLDPSIVSENAREFLTPKYESKRIPIDILFVIGGSTPGISTDSMQTYDAMTDQWLKIEEGDPTGPRTRHGVAAVGFNIYVIGGFHDDKFLDSVRCFNAVTKTWTEVKHMIDCRADFSVAVLGDLVYAIGGCNDGGRLNSAERYDHRTNKWARIASLNTDRTHASATALNGKVYVVGGFDGTYRASAEVFDPQKNEWTKISPMHSKRSGLCCVAFQGSVYAVGGFCEESRSTSSGEKYDPEMDTWTEIPNLSYPRGNFVLQVINDAIYAFGGIHDKTPIRQVERFDGGRHEWEKLADMTTPLRDGVSACVVERLPNVGDYIHKRKHQLVEEDGQGIEAKSDAPLTPKGDGQEDQDLDEH